jgi:hypothetical protein
MTALPVPLTRVHGHDIIAAGGGKHGVVEGFCGRVIWSRRAIRHRE